MHSFCLMAMVGAVASAQDLFAPDRRELVAGTEYEGFQNVVWAAQDLDLCAFSLGDCPEIRFDSNRSLSVGSSWYEQGGDDKILYYGLILELDAHVEEWQWQDFLRIEFLNEDETWADVIDIYFDDSSLDYTSLEMERVNGYYGWENQDEEGTMYYYTMNTDDGGDDLFTARYEPTNSSNAWKLDTSKSMKTAKNEYRLYFERSTPSVSGLAIGKTVKAKASWFPRGTQVSDYAFPYPVADRPVVVEEVIDEKPDQVTTTEIVDITDPAKPGNGWLQELIDGFADGASVLSMCSMATFAASFAGVLLQ